MNNSPDDYIEKDGIKYKLAYNFHLPKDYFPCTACEENIYSHNITQQRACSVQMLKEIKEFDERIINILNGA